MANGFNFIKNQPVSFDNETDPCNAFLDGGRCFQWKRDDLVEMQIGREPCGDNLLCNELEFDTLGETLLLNGEFADDASGWTVDEGGKLLWNSGAMCADGTGFGTYSQTITISTPGNYRLEFTLSRTAGEIAVEGSPVTPGDDITSFGNTYDSSGTFTVDIIALEPGDYLIGFTTVDFEGCVDDVLFRQVLACYNGAGWYKTDIGYAHLPGYNTALEAFTDVIGVGKVYKVVVSATGITEGSFVINVGSNASASIVSDVESKDFYIHSGTDTGFNIIPTTDFDGTVAIEQIYELTEVDWLYLTDMAGDPVADLTPYITYVDGSVNVAFRLSDLSPEVPSGCYRFGIKGICNPANSNIIINPTFLDGTTSFVEGWERNNGSFQYDTSGGGCEFIYEVSPGWSDFVTLRNDIQELFIPGQYEVTIVIESNSDTTNIGVSARIDTSYDDTPPTYFSTVGTHTFLIDYTTPAVEPFYGTPRLYLIASFALEETKTAGSIRVTSVTAKRIDNDETLNLSNCHQWKSDEELSCTKWLEGYGGCYGYGFDFRAFKLGMRIPILTDGPSYPNQQNNYLFSNGERTRTMGERDKLYRVVTDKISELEHDVLSTMLLCDTFTKDGVPYFFTGKAYQPQWPRNRRSSIARVELELSKDAVIMAANCGSCDPAPTFIPCAVLCETAIGLKSNYPAPPGTAGWYMVDGSNLLEYSNGTTYSGTTKTCEGYIEAVDQYGANPFQDGPWRWNSIAARWEPIIQITSVLADTPSAGVDTVSAIVLPGCIGKIQTSTDFGATWSDATSYQSSAQLASEVVYVRPGVAFRFRIEMKCAICTYTSGEITIYE